MFEWSLAVGLHVDGTGDSFFRAWNLDPFTLTAVVSSWALYSRGLAASRGTRRKLHPWWRPLLFYMGLGAILIALVSPVDHFADEYFFVHMVQHLLLLLVAPPLILLSAPMIPVLRGIPRTLRRSVIAPILRHPVTRLTLRYLSLPLIAWPLYVSTLLAWHIPSAYDLALRNGTVHVLEHVTFTIGALLFWWNIVDSVPLRGHLSYMARVPYIFLTTVPNFTLGAFLTFSSVAWYKEYDADNLIWGMTTLEDQQFGALIMWIPGSLILLTCLLMVLGYAVVSEERNQQEKEASMMKLGEIGEENAN